MIEYITGKIAALNPTSVVVETSGGVGYIMNITLPTYTALQGEQQARVLVHESIREDAYTLYGFLNQKERDMFRALIGVSGVGASTASLILSAIPVPELEAIIASGDDRQIKKVKGIGAKTAQRIIVDLKDKVKVDDGIEALLGNNQNSEVYDEAMAALLMLGFQKQAAGKALKKIMDTDPTIKVEGAIKKALAML